MKERPILFSGHMVRAILDGHKTQTRRVVKFPEVPTSRGEWKPSMLGGPTTMRTVNGMLTVDVPPFPVVTHSITGKTFACPHGQAGNRLWVRETWKYRGWSEDGDPLIEFAADGKTLWAQPPEEWEDRLEEVWATLSEPENFKLDNRAADRKWRPSIHMPRWASRLTLDLVKVRLERLQDISPADAEAEGMFERHAVGDDMHDQWTWQNVPGTHRYGSPVEAYEALWESVNGKGSWKANPLVWVEEFKRVKA